MSKAGDDISRTPDGVDTAWSERERMKNAFCELLGEMPAFQAFVSGTGARRTWRPGSRRSVGESRDQRALGALEKQATELQSKVSRLSRRAWLE